MKKYQPNLAELLHTIFLLLVKFSCCYFIIQNRKTYNIIKVSLAGIVVYSYSFLIPSLIYGFVRWRSGPFDFYMSDFISTYGYSLLTFVPMSMLLLVRNDTFNWLLVVLTLAVSGTVLAAKVWGATRHLDKKSILILVLVVLTLHTSLVLFIKLYFFSHIKVEDVVQATTISAGVNITQTGGS